MGNLKVLPLESWMKSITIDDALSRLVDTQINPVYNRPGYYMLNSYCWIETLIDGRLIAVTADPEMFKYSLDLLNIPCLSIKQKYALRTICDVGLANSDQKRILSLVFQKNEIEQTKRMARKYFCNIKK